MSRPHGAMGLSVIVAFPGHTHLLQDLISQILALYIRDTIANSEDPDEMQHDAAFHQGLHCL